MSQSSPDPRLIVSRTTPITLSTTFQEIVYNGSEAGKTMNTFEKTPLQISLCLIIIQQQTYLLITRFTLHNFNLLFEFRLRQRL
jgi:hypothetical protein